MGIITVYPISVLRGMVSKDFTEAKDWDARKIAQQKRSWKIKSWAAFILGVTYVLLANYVLLVFLPNVAHDVRRDFMVDALVYLLQFYLVDSVIFSFVPALLIGSIARCSPDLVDKAYNDYLEPYLHPEKNADEEVDRQQNIALQDEGNSNLDLDGQDKDDFVRDIAAANGVSMEGESTLAEPGALLDGWESAWSEEYSEIYYFNRKTGDRSWQKPAVLVDEEWLPDPNAVGLFLRTSSMDGHGSPLELGRDVDNLIDIEGDADGLLNGKGEDAMSLAENDACLENEITGSTPAAMAASVAAEGKPKYARFKLSAIKQASGGMSTYRAQSKQEPQHTASKLTALEQASQRILAYRAQPEQEPQHTGSELSALEQAHHRIPTYRAQSKQRCIPWVGYNSCASDVGGINAGQLGFGQSAEQWHDNACGTVMRMFAEAGARCCRNMHGQILVEKIGVSGKSIIVEVKSTSNSSAAELEYECQLERMMLGPHDAEDHIRYVVFGLSSAGELGPQASMIVKECAQHFAGMGQDAITNAKRLQFITQHRESLRLVGSHVSVALDI